MRYPGYLIPSSFIAISCALSGCGAPVTDARGVEVTQADLLKAPCAGSPYASIQAAIDAAPAGGTVTVCSGTFTERLTISKSLTLVATSGAATTILDAQGLGTGIAVTGGGTVVIDGFTIQNGSSAGTGGDVSCVSTGLTLRNSVLAAGTAERGGGLGATGCWGEATGNTFTGNHAWFAGGGVYVEGDLDVLDGTIDGNSSDVYGGGAYVTGGYGQVAGNTISNNSSVDDGGGLYMADGGGVVDGNTIVDNYSDDDGGGLRLKLSSAIVTNNEISRNIATNIGGGARISHEATTITGNVIADNEGYYKAGGIALYESASDFGDNTVTGNHAPEGGGLWIQGGWDDVLVHDSTISDNSADANGGNVFVNLVGHAVAFQRVDIVGGDADLGGGLYALDTSITAEATTFWANNAVTGGGAVYVKNTTGGLTNDVLYGNTSPGGAGIRISTGVAGFAVKNTIVQGNTGSAGVYLSSGTAPAWTYNDVWGNTKAYKGMAAQTGINGNLAVAAKFVNAAAGDFHLGAKSTLKDKGDPAILDVDGTRSDMGAWGGPQGY